MGLASKLKSSAQPAPLQNFNDSSQTPNFGGGGMSNRSTDPHYPPNNNNSQNEGGYFPPPAYQAQAYVNPGPDQYRQNYSASYHEGAPRGDYRKSSSMAGPQNMVPPNMPGYHQSGYIQQPPQSDPYNMPPHHHAQPPPSAPPYSENFSRGQNQNYGGYDHYPPPQGMAYAPTKMSHQPPQSSNTASHIYSRLAKCVQENRLQNLYSPANLTDLSQRLVSLESRVTTLAKRWKLSPEIMYDLYQLALYDVVILCDDSGSMAFEEGGERINDLKAALGYVAEATSIFDLDGIEVRFLNSPLEGTGITSSDGADNIVNKIRFSGLTPLGTALKKKILNPFLFDKLNQGSLRKPVLCIVITDGVPAGEPQGAIFDALNSTSEIRRRHGNVIAFEFAQVGLDQGAQNFLSELDVHPLVGDMVDVTSSYELEEAQMLKKNAQLTPELWIAKLLLGCIDATYDHMDE